MVFNNQNDNDRLYDNLEQSLHNLNPKPAEDSGLLGYQDDRNVYSVYSDISRDRFRVRLDDGSNIDAKHRGAVQPIPNLPVIIKYDKFNQPYIEGPDTAKQAAYAGVMSAQLSVGPHSHHRNSGMEFPIDPILISYFQPIVESDYTISIQPGYYVDGGVPQWFTGGTVDLSSISVTSGYHRWVMVLLDKSTSPVSLITQNGSEKIQALPLLESEVNQFTIPESQDPILIIKKISNTALSQRDIIVLSGRGAGNSVDNRGTIVTYEGEVVTYEGYVLRYNSTTNEVFTLE